MTQIGFHFVGGPLNGQFKNINELQTEGGEPPAYYDHDERNHRHFYRLEEPYFGGPTRRIYVYNELGADDTLGLLLAALVMCRLKE